MIVMPEPVVDREEVELMMWALADIRADVRQIGDYLMGEDGEEETEADEP
jgi:hypothetical protein